MQSTSENDITTGYGKRSCRKPEDQGLACKIAAIGLTPLRPHTRRGAAVTPPVELAPAAALACAYGVRGPSETIGAPIGGLRREDIAADRPGKLLTGDGLSPPVGVKIRSTSARRTRRAASAPGETASIDLSQCRSPSSRVSALDR